MKSRTLLWIVIGVVAAIILGSISFVFLQQLLARNLLTGEQALELLQASPYPHLLIEVDYTPGDNLTQPALDLMQTRLSTYTAKESIRFVFDIIAVNQTSFNTTDLVELERANRNHGTGGDTFTLYVLSISGELRGADGDGEGEALGAAYTASSLVLFKDVIRLVTTGLGRPRLEDIEGSVLVHELGHIMGLVNLVYTSELDYEDAGHPFHSNNTTDVMYWAIESAPFAQPPNDFGSETRFDLQKLRDGEYVTIPSRLRELPSALALVRGQDDRALLEFRTRWLTP